MIHEEAKEIVKRIKYYMEDGECWSESEFMAMDMAIKALSQEPCDNAIGREYLFKVLDDFCGHDRTATITLDTLADLVYDMPTVTQKPMECDDAISREWLMRKATERFYTTNYFNHISAMIEEAPSVTQKSGKWKHEQFPNFKVAWFCNKCGGGTYHKTNYCPNCGAKMESEDKK